MLEDIHSIIKSEDYPKAFRLLSEVKPVEPRFESAMQVWVNLAMKLHLLDEALKPIEKLCAKHPTNTQYIGLYQELLVKAERYDKLFKLLEARLKKRNNGSADDYFNLGFYARKAGWADCAIKYFEFALEKNVVGPEEVHLNLALVYSELLKQDEIAIDHLKFALSIAPNYVAAMHNLANLYEQHGLLNDAKTLFNRILALEPTNLTARARLSDLGTFSLSEAQNFEKNVLTVLPQAQDIHGEVDIYYALGKVFDDAKDYATAWSYYLKANALNKHTLPAYDKSYYESLIQECKTRELTIAPVCSNVQPIIICGMFRSGSTLLERIVGSNPSVAMGGEIEYLHKTLFGKINEELLNTLKAPDFGRNYVQQLTTVSANALYVTDKRPENFMYLDVVKALFPQAKIVWTHRELLDNCLSAFFQRLGPTQNYATELSNILHYYSVQERMLTVWSAKFDADIHVVSYDELVKTPQDTTRKLCEFLGFPYNDEDKKFHRLEGGVKTASVWQVRRPLYQSSSGRINNYRDAILNSNASAEFIELLSR